MAHRGSDATRQEAATNTTPKDDDAVKPTTTATTALAANAGSASTDANVPTQPAAAAAAQDRSEPRQPFGTRGSWALVVIAVLLALYTVYFARTVLMPIAAGVMLALLLRPIVRRLRRYRIPEPLGAVLTLLFVVGAFIAVFANLVGPANSWMEDAPSTLRTAGEKLRFIREHVDDLSRASQIVEEIADGEKQTEQDSVFPFAPEPAEQRASGNGHAHEMPPEPSEESSPPLAGEQNSVNDSSADLEEPIAVEIQQPRLLTSLQAATSTGSVLAGLIVMTVLAYFLLATGDVLINNLLHILPSMREKRNTVELIHNVERGISSYLLTVTIINIMLGVAEASAMWLLGMPNPLLWGAMAALFNFVPVLGALCGTVIVFVVAVLSFDSLGYAFVPPLVFWAVTAIEGNLVTPHILGRSMSLNPIMVFLSLAIWGWMWGIGGAVLAVPILAVLKVGFDQFERTQAIGTLLGGNPRNATD